MVICIVAMVVFGAMALFSARYRPIAREAFDCTIRKMTLRPCASGLDERIRARAVAKVLKYSPPAARQLNRHYAAVSIMFSILFFASLGYSAYSLYNWVAYGNCYGPEAPPGSCILPDLYNRSAHANATVCPTATPAPPAEKFFTPAKQEGAAPKTKSY